MQGTVGLGVERAGATTGRLTVAPASDGAAVRFGAGGEASVGRRARPSALPEDEPRAAGRGPQRIDHRGPLRRLVRTGEPVILPVHGNGPDRPLDDLVVDFDFPVPGVPDALRPPRPRVPPRPPPDPPWPAVLRLQPSPPSFKDQLCLRLAPPAPRVRRGQRTAGARSPTTP